MSFSINNEDKVILQKFGLPEHLSKLENLDVPVTLQSLILDLQDAGEVTLIWITFQNILYIFVVTLRNINLIMAKFT